MTKTTGRPALPESERRVPFSIRLTPHAIDRIKAVAAEEGVDVSEWVRDRLREACENRGRAVP